VAAGKPIYADEDRGSRVVVHASMARGGKSFALRIKGDSMRDAGIMNGDLAIVESRNDASDGEIVVALVEDSVTLKRFFRENNRIRLQAENPAYPPIYTQDLRIRAGSGHHETY
jgi:repressor LexA